MATTEEADLQEDIQNISTLFKEGLDLFNNLGRSDEATNSFNVQCNVKKCIKIFENVTRLVSYAGIFSRNEGIEEVATADLQYFLLPAILGSLNLKLTSGERRNIVEVTEVYFRDFMQRCIDYNLTDYKLKEVSETKPEATEEKEKPPMTEMEELTAMAKRRAFKIRRYKEQQELKKKLEDLKKNMENEHADEEIKRNYFLTMIQLYIFDAVDELDSLEMEKPLLDRMEKANKEEKQKPKKRPPPSLKPVIITKDEIQKAVFGAGYPGLPTMTVQEFYDKRVQDGVFPDPTKPKKGPMSLQEAAIAGLPVNDGDKEEQELERAIENDTPEYLERQRHQDDFKDDHRRGWGNRANRS